MNAIQFDGVKTTEIAGDVDLKKAKIKRTVLGILYTCPTGTSTTAHTQEAHPIQYTKKKKTKKARGIYSSCLTSNTSNQVEK